MSSLQPDFLQFFRELAANNDRDWFKAQKKRYESSVKRPFNELIALLIDRISAIDPTLLCSPNEAIFRIHRDVRFSADKSPYKTHAAALIAPGGRKGMHLPGVYLQFGPEHARLYSGVYQPDKDQLYRIRSAIAAQPGRFAGLISDPVFVEKFGAIQGEKNKRLAAEWTEAAERQPLLFNKSFYYFVEWPAEFILQDDLAERVVEYYLASRPLGKFFTEAVKG